MSSPAAWPAGIPRPPDPPDASFALWERDGELAHLVALQRQEAIGPLRLRAALEAFGSPRGIWRASAAELAAVPGFGSAAAEAAIRARQTRDPARELSDVVAEGLHLVLLPSPEYPERLRHVFDPPLVLFRQGPPGTDWERVVAIVGTRRSSLYGETQARRLGRDLARVGVLVVSGLARGIDTAAHLGALEAGGPTAAFLGGSHDRFWPPENRNLRDRMLAAGQTVWSEYAPGTPPRKWRFPARNRLVAAAAHAVVVVEAPARSGALITARFASDQATEVLVVPGPVDGERFGGSHWLLREGARLVRNADDVLADLGWERPVTGQLPLGLRGADLDADEARILEAMSAAGDRPDELATRLAMPVSAVLAALSGLQLKAYVSRQAGPTYFLSC